MATAHIEAHRRYRHPFVTVGMDIYNIEAEALGCGVRFYADDSIPGIVTHPYDPESDPGKIKFSVSAGRIGLILDAAVDIKHAIGDDAIVSVGICGPFSIMIELLGYDSAVDAFIDGDARLAGFLDALLIYSKEYCTAIIERNLGVTIFDSWAAPPLSSPDIYRTYSAPYEHGLISHLERSGLKSRPLVIGGDTSLIVNDILNTGTTLLVSDYNSPLSLFCGKAKEKEVILRANIDPRRIWNGDWDYVRSRIEDIYSIYESYSKIIIGTGVMPYDTPPGHIERIMEIIDQQIV